MNHIVVVLISGHSQKSVTQIKLANLTVTFFTAQLVEVLTKINNFRVHFKGFEELKEVFKSFLTEFSIKRRISLLELEVRCSDLGLLKAERHGVVVKCLIFLQMLDEGILEEITVFIISENNLCCSFKGLRVIDMVLEVFGNIFFI